MCPPSAVELGCVSSRCGYGQRSRGPRRRAELDGARPCPESEEGMVGPVPISCEACLASVPSRDRHTCAHYGNQVSSQATTLSPGVTPGHTWSHLVCSSLKHRHPPSSTVTLNHRHLRMTGVTPPGHNWRAPPSGLKHRHSQSPHCAPLSAAAASLPGGRCACAHNTSPNNSHH